jgi:uncharacterized YkwD family protein
MLKTFRWIIIWGLTIFTFTFSIHPADAAARAAVDRYTVRPGDSLWKIAQKYHIGWPEIYQANRSKISNPALIYPGQVLSIPLPDQTVSSYERQVVDLCNQIRSRNGLSPLSLNWELARVARMKSQDMRNRNYFSHQSPTYGSPFDMMKSFGIRYSYAGENIAAGQRTPQEVVNSWMNSPGHRANILNPNYTQIGVGYASGGRYGTYWTQMFIRP